MGRHSSNWAEVDHPRAFDGTFAHSAGGGGGGADSRNGRGMPDVVTTADIPVRDGREIAMDFHPDGAVTVTAGKYSARMDEAQFAELTRKMDNLDSEDAEPGDEATIVHREVQNGAAFSTLQALVRKEDDGTVSLRLAPNDNPSHDELRDAPEVRLNAKDVEKVDKANTRSQGSSRIDTGNGDVDILITDDNKFAIRHLGDDGRPLETKLNPKSWAKVSQAVDSVIDGWDDEDDSLADDEVVTTRSVATNAGKVTVERTGDPGDETLSITADDGSWGIVIDHAHEKEFHDAVSKVQQAGEALRIYDASMKWKK